MTGETPIRDAATIVLLRRDGDRPRVLMGQRGASAVFMPDKFVFPGGAVDPDDIALATSFAAEADPRLSETDPELARALPFAAIRELWEETGLLLGRPATAALPSDTIPEGWRGFLAEGLWPHTEAARLIFRAITPPGRPRRFDARFFIAEATDLAGSPEDFSNASGELSFLAWVDLAEARELALPFITEVVLAEIDSLLETPDQSRPVPFFNHDAEGSRFRFL